MGTTLPGGLKTIDEGQHGWETIVNYNSGLIDDLLAAAGFMAGLKLEWVSTSSVKVLPGACRSDDGVDNIILAAEITIALPGDLDTGSEAVDTWYYTWLFKRPADGDIVAKFSVSPTAPTAPAGYTEKRLVGSVRNDGSSNLLDLVVLGNGRSRLVRYVEDLATVRVLSGGISASFASVDCSDFAPPSATGLLLQVSNHGTDTVEVSVDGSRVNASCQPGDTVVVLVPGNTVEYRALGGGSAYIEVLGYTEEL